MEKLRPKTIASVIFVSINIFLRFLEATVDVRAGQFKGYGSDISLNGHLIGVYSGIKLLRCSIYCFENPLCAAFKFDSFTQKCELLSATSQDLHSDVVDSAGVWHYHLINPEPTIEVTTHTDTTAVQNGTVMHTAELTKVRTVRQTTKVTGPMTRLTTKPSTEQTTEQTTERTTEPTTEPTTKRTTEPTTPEQATSAGCKQITTITDCK